MTRPRRRRPALLLAAVAASALLLAGCTVNGGGWIPGNYAKKATFGFTWVGDNCGPAYIGIACDPTRAKGAWSDGPVKFRIQEGGLTSIGIIDGCFYGEGTYVSTGKTRLSGSISIKLCDRGEPGASSGDEVYVNLTSGPYSGYAAGGVIQGGNIQLTDPEDI